MKSYYLQTERLLLRGWENEDIDPFSALNADESVMEFFPEVRSRAETKKAIARFSNHFDKHNFGFFAAEELETGRFIGFIGLSNVGYETDFTPCVEIGWRLAVEHWGKGYATEGARACLEFGFQFLNLNKVYSFTPILNTRSENVMRKLGMKKVGVFEHPRIETGHHLREHVLYQIQRS